MNPIGEEIGAALTNWLALADFTHNTFGVENKHMTSTFEEMAGKFFGIWFGHSLANEVEQIVGFHIPQLKEFKSTEYKFGESLGIQVGLKVFNDDDVTDAEQGKKAGRLFAEFYGQN